MKEEEIAVEHGNDRISEIVDAHYVQLSTGSTHLIASSEYLLLRQIPPFPLNTFSSSKYLLLFEIPPPSWIEASLAVEAVVKLSFESERFLGAN